MTIRAKFLLTFFAAIILGIGSTLLIVTGKMDTMNERSTQAYMEHALSSTNDYVALFFKQAQESAAMLAATPAVREAFGRLPLFTANREPQKVARSAMTPEARAVDEIFQLVKDSHTNYSSVTFGAEDGGFLEYPLASWPAGHDPRTKKWYRQQMEGSRAVNISSAYTTAQGVPACAVTAKVAGPDGKPLGVIDIDITLSALVSMVEGIKIGQTGSIILLEDNGMVLAAPQYKSWVNRNISQCDVPALQNLLAAGGTGTLALDGVEKRVVVYKGFQNWSMIALIDESEVNAAMNEALRQVLLAGAAITAVLFLLALWIVQSIRKPLHQMVQCTTSISNGDLDCLPPAKRFSAELLELHTGLSRITDTCKSMRTQVTATVGNVADGYLRSSINESEFRGDFKKIVESINGLAGSMLAVIDKIPSPIMIRDAQRKIRFLNEAGMLGGKAPEKMTGSACSGHFRADACAAGCAADKCFASGRKENMNTVSHPADSAAIDMFYTALPYGSDAVLALMTDQTQMLQAQRQIMEVAGEVEEVGTKLSAASHELAHIIALSDQGAERQAMRVGETASAMEEMNSTVLEVARNAEQAANMAMGTREKAQQGAEIVRKSVNCIQTVQSQSLQLKNDMNTLNRNAADISQIMSVISDIADQTNLLALNAAIEAARAGDAGRGFAVVADEVRKLAEKTMSSTTEVARAITAIQSSAGQSVTSVDASTRSIEEATTFVTLSGTALEEIVSMVDTTADQVRAIATASEEQSATSDEINRSVNEINEIGIKTAQGMRDANLAVSGLKELSQTLDALLKTMKLS